MWLQEFAVNIAEYRCAKHEFQLTRAHETWTYLTPARDILNMQSTYENRYISSEAISELK